MNHEAVTSHHSLAIRAAPALVDAALARAEAAGLRIGVAVAEA